MVGMRFDGFAGNEEVKKRLSAYVDGGRLPHALLFEGPEGSGRRTLARITAAAAVCRSDGEKPCGRCAACVKAASGNHPDILIAGGDGAARSFHIDAIREIRDKAYVLPNESERRVMILAGAQGLTEQAQNALLKIIEEPPRHLLFILTCENRAQLLETIQSRTFCLTLGAVPEEDAVRAVRERMPEAGEDDVRKTVTVFGGIVGQALKGLSDGSFQQILAQAPLFARAVTAPDELDLLRLTGKLEKDKKLADGILGALARLFHEALLLRFRSDETVTSISPETAGRLARTLTREQLSALIRTTEDLQRARLQNINYTLFLTLLCSRLRAAAGR